MCRRAPGEVRRVVHRMVVLFTCLALTGAARELRAQNTISVPFTNGFIGTRGSSAGTANSVLTYATLGIARTFFIQSSSTNTFEIQGNDIPGTLRIVRTDGTTLDIPASANWRNSSGNTVLIGILPRPASPITFAYTGGSIQITDGTVSGGSSVGGYVAAYTGAMAADGSNISGNAAQSQLLIALNSYLSTVVSSRPAGPVTVAALTTSNLTPTITGTATLAAGENLSVVVGGVQYTAASTPGVVLSGNAWSLALTTPLAVGTHSVTATITNLDGFTLSDGTSNELVVTLPLVTIGGAFTADDKTYDKSTAATGTTGGLTLLGVNAAHQVSIASITLAFQTAAAGSGKTVVITSVTLGGANAAQYSADLTGAPTATASISPKALAIGGSFAAANKPFDGTPAATITTDNLTLTGAIGGDAVALTGVTAAFADSAVGTGKTVSLTAASLTGAAAGNYTMTLVGAPTTTANITMPGGPVTIAGSFSADDKTYDGTVSATGTTASLTLSGVGPLDQVSIASVTLEFQTASAAAGKTVVITGVTLGGPDAAAYTVNLTGAPTATAAITPRALMLGGSFSAADKTYDGTTAATITTNNLTLTGAVAGDAVALTGPAAAFADAAVGTAKTVTLTTGSLTGADAANYILSTSGAPTTTASILAGSPPSAPRNVEPAAGEGSVSVAWIAPAAPGCSAISAYLVEYSSYPAATWTRVTLAAPVTTPVTLSGLANNFPYVVRVAAVNACGTGPYSATAGPVVPIAPTRGIAGGPVSEAPGTGSVTSGGVRQPVILEVVQDTMVRLTTGTFALTLRAVDDSGTALGIDSSRTVLLEQGGRATAAGSGFAPGTFVTVYLFAPTGQPLLAGMVAVGPDGSFTTTFPIPDDLTPGHYTIQVNGIDSAGTPRAASLGVEVLAPPADLVLTAIPDEMSPAVGDTITIAITVTNRGRGPAIDVVIPRAFREPGFSTVQATPLEGTYDSSTQEWKIARIEPGTSARMRLTVVVVPPSSAPPEGSIP